MPIITLTTDYGLRDPYAGQLKGALLSACPTATLVDVTHEIAPYDLVDAAYFLQHTHDHYPEGTIHVCTVDNTFDCDPDWLSFRYEGQVYLVLDNGLPDLLWPTAGLDLRRVPADGAGSTKAALGAAIAKLALGYDPTHIGPAATDAVRSLRPEPVTNPKFIRGSIIHIDRYDNAVLNIHRSLVERMAQGRRIHTRFSSSDPIVDIVDHYHEVPEGELLARYNSRGYVELAINMGRAAQLFGLQRDQLVQLEFEGTAVAV